MVSRDEIIGDLCWVIEEIEKRNYADSEDLVAVLQGWTKPERWENEPVETVPPVTLPGMVEYAFFNGS